MSMRPMRPVSALAAAIVLLAAACSSEPDQAAIEVARTGLASNAAFVTKDWPTDWSKSEIDLAELILGVGDSEPRDSIPPIDEPQYESPTEAADWLEDRQPGALVQLNGDVRFFPLAIMTRHEIVNGEVGGVPLAVTYCPLCNTAIAFDRRVDGDTLRFGVSGLLRNSDLVMWDDKTVSLWQQITGEAIVGDFSGTELDQVTTAIVSFGDFRSGFPEGLSLSRDTGFERTYGINRYEGYSGRFATLFPMTTERDHRFFPMERVVGVSVDDDDKAYPFVVLNEEHAVNDVVGGVPVAVLWGSPDTVDPLNLEVIANSKSIGTAIAFNRVVDGQTLTFASVGDMFVDAETSSTWTILGMAVDGPLAGTQLEILNHRNEFWFAWTAFFPDADVYGS